MALSISRLFSFGLEVDKSDESSKRTCTKLFNQAEDAIVILSGELNEEFYSDRSVCRALAGAAKRGISLNVGYGPQASNKILTALRKLGEKHGHVQLHPLSERPDRHFTVIDGKTTRVQLLHQSGTKEHRAVTRYNSPDVALSYLSLFKSMVGESDPE